MSYTTGAGSSLRHLGPVEADRKPPAPPRLCTGLHPLKPAIPQTPVPSGKDKCATDAKSCILDPWCSARPKGHRFATSVSDLVLCPCMWLNSKHHHMGFTAIQT